MPKSDNLIDRLDELFSVPSDGDAPKEIALAQVEEFVPRAVGVGAAMFETAFEYISIGMVVSHPDTQLIRVNDAFAGMLGYTRQELEGKSFQDITFENDLSLGAEAVQALLSGERDNARFLKRYVHKDGDLIWVDLNVTLIRDESGDPLYFVTLVQDVSEQQNMASMLDKRVRELDCLSDIGHKMDERPPLPEFLQWVTGHITDSFLHPDVCVSAIEYGEKVYGAREAMEMPSKVVGGLRVAGELVGWLHVAYTEQRDFVDQESALLGGIVSRVSSYLESQTLFEQAQEALAQGNLFRQFAETSGQAIGMATLEGEITYANPRLANMAGVDAPDALYGQNFISFYPPDLVEQLQEEVLPTVMTEGMWTGELPLTSPQGEAIPAIWNLFAIRDDEGKPIYLANVITDISERTQAEEALRQSQETLQTLVEYAPEAIVVVDVDTGLFIDPNDNAAHLYGLSREELLKVGPADMSPPQQPDGRPSTEKAIEYITEAMEGGAPVFEWVHRNAAGEDFPCEVRLVRMPVAGRKLVRASVTDITERKLAQETVAKRAAELGTVAEVGTTAATALDAGELIQSVVDLTTERFDLYHAHIYLLDETGESLELAAGAFEVGRTMVEQGWRIPLDSERSLVARSARQRQSVIVNDVRADPDFLPNELLPDTASEMAVPLIAGDQLLGVLDVQSEDVDHFTDEDASIQTTLASQVAIALQNARQYGQTQAALAQTDELYQISHNVNEASSEEELLQALAQPAIQAGAYTVTLMYLDPDEKGDPEWTEVVATWFEEGGESTIPVGSRFYLPEMPMSQLWIADPNEPLLISNIDSDERVDDIARSLLETASSRATAIIPMTRAGQQVALIIFSWNEPHQFSPQEVETYRSLIGLGSPAVYSRRLFEQFRARAQREQALREITTRVRGSMNPDAILRAAVRELGDALGRRTFVRLGGVEGLSQGSEKSDGGDRSDGSNGRQSSSETFEGDR